MSRIFLDTWLISKSCAKLMLFVLACAAAGLVHSVSAGRAHARTVRLPGCWGSRAGQRHGIAAVRGWPVWPWPAG